MSEIIFVCDLFLEHYIGGAELTTNALFEKTDRKIKKILSSEITPFFIKNNNNKIWIFGNFSNLSHKLRLEVSKKIKNYSIIEYDYKLCQYRSMELHKKQTKKECDCIDTLEGKMNQIFYSKAQAVWFMSKEQKQIFLSRIKTIKEEKSFVLSSVFEECHLNKMLDLSSNDKNNKFAIIKSNSWIKGFEDSLAYAKKNNLDFDILENLEYNHLLEAMSKYKGMIFLPRGKDTCPRIVIESFLMGLECILNENVQHKNEDWFQTKDSCLEYLKNNADRFWRFYETN
jgi:hypothetical protein